MSSLDGASVKRKDFLIGKGLLEDEDSPLFGELFGGATTSTASDEGVGLRSTLEEFLHVPGSRSCRIVGRNSGGSKSCSRLKLFSKSN